MLILASLAEHAQALARLEQSQKSNKKIKPAALSGRLFFMSSDTRLVVLVT
jgi:hypothetical protein